LIFFASFFVSRQKMKARRGERQKLVPQGQKKQLTLQAI